MKNKISKSEAKHLYKLAWMMEIIKKHKKAKGKIKPKKNS